MRVGREMGMDNEREQPYNSATRVTSIPFLLNARVRCMHLVQHMTWHDMAWHHVVLTCPGQRAWQNSSAPSSCASTMKWRWRWRRTREAAQFSSMSR